MLCACVETPFEIISSAGIAESALAPRAFTGDAAFEATEKEQNDVDNVNTKRRDNNASVSHWTRCVLNSVQNFSIKKPFFLSINGKTCITIGRHAKILKHVKNVDARPRHKSACKRLLRDGLTAGRTFLFFCALLLSRQRLLQ